MSDHMAAENVCELCSPPKAFKNRQGFLGHQALTHASTAQDVRFGETIGGLLQRLAAVEQRCDVLEEILEEAHERLEELARKVEEHSGLLGQTIRVLDKLVKHVLRDVEPEASTALSENNLLLFVDDEAEVEKLKAALTQPLK